MSGIIGVYSLVISVLIAEDLNPPSNTSYTLFAYVPPAVFGVFSDSTPY
jgi:V-type H+-transporting ATPase proteolipid subunit